MVSVYFSCPNTDDDNNKFLILLLIFVVSIFPKIPFVSKPSIYRNPIQLFLIINGKLRQQTIGFVSTSL